MQLAAPTDLHKASYMVFILLLFINVRVQAALQSGIETLSQAEVGSALQVYFNLGLLTQVNVTRMVISPVAACIHLKLPWGCLCSRANLSTK